MNFDYQFAQPVDSLLDFVESFWVLRHLDDTGQEVILLPDGRIDVIFSRSATKPFQVLLLGISTRPDRTILEAGTCMFAVSFELSAAEYIIGHPVSALLDHAAILTDGLWDIEESDLVDFEAFQKKVTLKILESLPKDVDSRKKALFHYLYESEGAMSVQELSEKVFWSSRQINRYFQQQFGIPLKAYCNILRFRASFGHIRKGKLFPEHNFSDQSHFIREVKKLSGVLPKTLKKNQDDRFIQFSTLRSK